MKFYCLEEQMATTSNLLKVFQWIEATKELFRKGKFLSLALCKIRFCLRKLLQDNENNLYFSTLVMFGLFLFFSWIFVV